MPPKRGEGAAKLSEEIQKRLDQLRQDKEDDYIVRSMELEEWLPRVKILEGQNSENLRAAINLFARHEISMERASEVAAMHLQDFMELLASVKKSLRVESSTSALIAAVEAQLRKNDELMAANYQDRETRYRLEGGTSALSFVLKLLRAAPTEEVA